jgi:hypothetical protein
MSQLQRLSAYPNIKVLGYVHVSYGDKDNTVVERDIDTYWSWAANDPDKIIRIDGIFFDEAPAGPEGIDKMNGLATRVRSTERWTRSVAATNPASDVSTHGSEVASQVRVPGAAGADMEECSSGPCTKQKREATTTSRPLVVFNPGMPVDRAYYQLADYVVAFEQSYQVWTENQTAFMAQVPPDLRRKSIVILHTFPSSTASLNELVTTFASAGIGGQFVTEQAGGGYSVWWTRWDEYVNLVSAAAAAAPTGRTG